MITLYGVGTTIGAGIYVLVGKVAGAAGLLAPLSFGLAALLAGFSALSFAELSARFPRSAGEAVYVNEGLRNRRLGTVVGLLVVLTGIISSAAIAIGAAGYLNTLVTVPSEPVVVGIIIALGAIAAWGIREAVTIAVVLTLIEIAGLLLIVWVGRDAFAAIPETLAAQPPEFDLAVLLGVGSGVILAFFAFIGFEDMVNVAEEIRDVRRTLPRAIILTLVITTVIYLVVALVAAFSLPIEQVAASEAPLALIYTEATGKRPIPISLISLVAVVNGALIQNHHGLARAVRFGKPGAVLCDVRDHQSNHADADCRDGGGYRRGSGVCAGAAPGKPGAAVVPGYLDCLRAGEFGAGRSENPPAGPGRGD
jgi:amino acid transporter